LIHDSKSRYHHLQGNAAFSKSDHVRASGEPKFEGATCSRRTCDLNAKGFSRIDETITIYDEKRILAFDVTEGTPGFVKHVNSHWQIIEISPNQCRVEITAVIEAKKFMGTLMGGMFKKNINTVLPVVLNDLKVYAETGETSDLRKQRVAKLESKKYTSF